MRKLQEIRQKLAQQLCQEPTEETWAEQANLPVPKLRKILQSGQQARNKLCTDPTIQDLLRKTARRYSWRACGLDQDDLEQEGALGLVKAMDKFKPEKGCQFHTYVRIFIKRAIQKALRRNRPNKPPQQLGKSSSPYESAYRPYLRLDVRLAIEKLEPQEQAVIKGVYFQELTQAEVAEQLGLETQEISRIRERAFKQLRAHLRDYVMPE